MWVDVVGYEGLYQVSNSGEVKSMPRAEEVAGRHPEAFLRKRKEKLLSIRNGRYKNVTLYKDGTGKCFTVHRLVATAFIPNPNNLPEVNHIDEDRHNNSVDNLEWCTRQANSAHSSHKTTGSKCGTSKLKEADVLEIARLLSDGLPQTEIAKMFGVSNHAVFRIKAGYNWSWLTGFGKGDTKHARLD